MTVCKRFHAKLSLYFQCRTSTGPGRGGRALALGTSAWSCEALALKLARNEFIRSHRSIYSATKEELECVPRGAYSKAGLSLSPPACPLMGARERKKVQDPSRKLSLGLSFDHPCPPFMAKPNDAIRQSDTAFADHSPMLVASGDTHFSSATRCRQPEPRRDFQ